MSLNYYMFCRKSYQSIISDIKDIIFNYDEIMQKKLYDSNNELYNIKEEEDYLYKQICIVSKPKIFYRQEQNRINELKELCDQKILELCCHEIEDDYIDFGPENGMHIKYCKICETTF